MRISVIILHHGSSSLTLACLQSIEESHPRENLEIILVDNGSPAEIHRELVNGIKSRGIRLAQLIRLEENVGFSRGMNEGIAVATGELLIALNSDVLVGRNFPNYLLTHAQGLGDDVAFLAVPVYTAELVGEVMRKTNKVQGEVVGLTWYSSCMPVRFRELSPSFVLGPPGPAIIMPRSFIKAMKSRFGFVFNPTYFLYGEDVDLFLRAKRQGFRTVELRADIEREEVIWHVGSASASTKGVRTIDKSPEVVGRVLAGCIRNICAHSGLIELLPLILMHLLFRVAFCVLYGRKTGWSAAAKVWAAGFKSFTRRRPYRSSLGFFMLPLVALSYTKPFPWARAVKVSEVRAIASGMGA